MWSSFIHHIYSDSVCHELPHMCRLFLLLGSDVWSDLCDSYEMWWLHAASCSKLCNKLSRDWKQNLLHAEQGIDIWSDRFVNTNPNMFHSPLTIGPLSFETCVILQSGACVSVLFSGHKKMTLLLNSCVAIKACSDILPTLPWHTLYSHS